MSPIWIRTFPKSKNTFAQDVLLTNNQLFATKLQTLSDRQPFTFSSRLNVVCERHYLKNFTRVFYLPLVRS